MTSLFLPPRLEGLDALYLYDKIPTSSLRTSAYEAWKELIASRSNLEVDRQKLELETTNHLILTSRTQRSRSTTVRTRNRVVYWCPHFASGSTYLQYLLSTYVYMLDLRTFKAHTYTVGSKQLS